MSKKMIPRKRQVKHWTFVVGFFMISALAFIWVSTVQAQGGTYPSQPVRVIVGFRPAVGLTW